MPTFLVDECVSLQTTLLLRALGFHTESIHALGLRGMADSEVFKIAQEGKAILLTYDRGFGNIRKYPPRSHNGIIVLRAYDSRSLRGCHRVLEKLLKLESEFKGALFIVDQNKYRKRR